MDGFKEGHNVVYCSIFMSIVYYILCICRLRVVVLDVSDRFVVAGRQITTCLSYILVVAREAFQLLLPPFNPHNPQRTKNGLHSLSHPHKSEKSPTYSKKPE